MIARLLIFLVVNFAALALGGLATKNGVSSDWYTHLNKAPWTPPGWVFGAAWTSIMVCYAIYMAYAWNVQADKKYLLTLFIAQWILNVAWNPVFFAYQLPIIGLVIILALTVLIGYILLSELNLLKVKSLLLAPYFIWLLIASSLNAYIVIKN
ncbi:MAG: TspO/MBR family protein [Bacteroidota bacterium]|nr:TspO/MBR family protein [Bacteroidota bacterium]